jgi:D-glycero-alpha-D-manno-heptose-7-phosphate kinase
VKRELNRRLMLFFTGGTREARQVLARQNAKTDSNLSSIRRLCAIACEMRDVLTIGRDLNVFGRLLHEAWQVKKTLEKSISNPRIDEYYDRALGAGALGGKLLGAGSGGFILFYCEPHYQEKLRHALADLTEVPIGFDPQGTKVIYVGEDHW